MTTGAQLISETVLSESMAQKHQISNCKYASSFYYNIFYCDQGKYML